jgi:acetone carboxylase gamma subunit
MKSKEINQGTVHACKAAQRLGTVYNKRAICPGCGKVAEVEAITFEIAVIEGRIKEIQSPKADGLRWCNDCQGGRE